MSDDSVYQKILRPIGRVRDCFNNNNNEEPEDEFGSVPIDLRGDQYLIRNGAWLFEDLVKYTRGNMNSFRIFSQKELQEANQNVSADQFLNRETYRGNIEDRHVVVKFVDWALMRQVVSLSLIKHRNVVKLLGCCLTEFPIVVYELPPNGTLEENISKLPWTDRLRIATEIADVVAYLHSELHMTHGSLDSNAVLLDEFYYAKLGLFDNSCIQNKAKSSDVGTDNGNKFRKLEDVQDFGSILLNILFIQKGDRSEFTGCKEKAEFLKYLKPNVSEMLQTDAYIDLLLRCLSVDKLPSMEEVARELRHIRSMINHQLTADENQSDNISSGANASTSYQEAKSYY